MSSSDAPPRSGSRVGGDGGHGGFAVRCAKTADIPALQSLIERSARSLCAVDYTDEQIEGALGTAWAVDTQLIEDATYFVIERHEGGAAEIVACGGWSHRGTLFGGDAATVREARRLDPTTESARVRAFFIAPEHARRGLGSLLLERCEHEAAAAGFGSCELVATLTGVRLYAARGYVAREPIEHPLPAGGTIRFVPMVKQLSG
ncbi:MAG: GNAT family N-acetyltransferase [Acidobacteria bacterium]|nr:MAG: GNAT family N-acetyltransferase [Acidobacteriota bacterium]REK08780.1 MAG: GNAT family N-acetyltransferase [Acidobacteriota bacterium]